ncbi:hypothetical protein T484DRAFT_1759731 [Baffinella frigidus]|nr:hypothetical protein T484DRAFT_1759731 [Cryptophyta sp. CCMP2293]
MGVLIARSWLGESDLAEASADMLNLPEFAPPRFGDAEDDSDDSMPELDESDGDSIDEMPQLEGSVEGLSSDDEGLSDGKDGQYAASMG